ncbi:MAG: hypothetical protein PVF49_06655 [Anaerolineales bacterium]|jgi:hypothetical protein
MWFDPAITLLYLNNLSVLAFAAGFVYFWLADRRSIYSYWLFR